MTASANSFSGSDPMEILESTTVRDIMVTDLITVSSNSCLREALRAMYDARLASLVVVNETSAQGVGILTQKDLVGALFDGAEDLDETLVEDLMTSPAITVSPNYSVGACLQMMRMTGVRRMIVMENDLSVGIVSLADVFRRATESVL
jgi:CBS domain-containing protein